MGRGGGESPQETQDTGAAEGDGGSVCDGVCGLLSRCNVSYCTVQHCIVLYCTVLYCTVLYSTVMYRTVPISLITHSIFLIYQSVDCLQCSH